MFPLAPSGFVLFTSHKKMFVSQELYRDLTEQLPCTDNRNREIHVYSKKIKNIFYFFFLIYLGHISAVLHIKCFPKTVGWKWFSLKFLIWNPQFEDDILSPFLWDTHKSLLSVCDTAFIYPIECCSEVLLWVQKAWKLCQLNLISALTEEFYCRHKRIQSWYSQ